MNTGQKIPLGKSLNEIAIQKALNHYQQTGQPLPASIVKVKGSIATIKFEVGGGFNLPNIEIPIGESFWSRGGHKAGDKGMVSPAYAGIGHMSGLGPSGAPGLAKPGNLAALIFNPMGHASWPDTGGKRINQADKGAINQTPDEKNQAGALPGYVLLKAAGVAAHLGPQAIARLAQLIGASSSGGGGSSGSSTTDTTTGITTVDQLVLAYQYVQPAGGATVQILDGVVVTSIDSSSTLATLTVGFPASPADGQVQFLSFTNAVTALTLSGGSFSANAPAAVSSGGGSFMFQFQSTSGKWMLV